MAADRIAQASGTPNVPDEPPVVSAFAVRRLDLADPDLTRRTPAGAEVKASTSTSTT